MPHKNEEVIYEIKLSPPYIENCEYIGGKVTHDVLYNKLLLNLS